MRRKGVGGGGGSSVCCVASLSVFTGQRSRSSNGPPLHTHHTMSPFLPPEHERRQTHRQLTAKPSLCSENGVIFSPFPLLSPLLSSPFDVDGSMAVPPLTSRRTECIAILNIAMPTHTIPSSRVLQQRPTTCSMEKENARNDQQTNAHKRQAETNKQTNKQTTNQPTNSPFPLSPCRRQQTIQSDHPIQLYDTTPPIFHPVAFLGLCAAAAYLADATLLFSLYLLFLQATRARVAAPRSSKHTHTHIPSLSPRTSCPHHTIAKRRVTSHGKPPFLEPTPPPTPLLPPPLVDQALHTATHSNWEWSRRTRWEGMRLRGPRDGRRSFAKTPPSPQPQPIPLSALPSTSPSPSLSPRTRRLPPPSPSLAPTSVPTAKASRSDHAHNVNVRTK